MPPHKDGHDIASVEDRFQMIQTATDGVPFLEPCDVELVRSGTSYTVDTLRGYRERLGALQPIYFILGIDAFADIITWKSYRELFSLARFIVMARPGAGLKDLGSFIREYISDAYEQDGSPNRFRHPEWHTIHRLSITHINISATEIRKRIRERRSVRFLVPSQVDAFILDKGLYL